MPSLKIRCARGLVHGSASSLRPDRASWIAALLSLIGRSSAGSGRMGIGPGCDRLVGLYETALAAPRPRCAFRAKVGRNQPSAGAGRCENRRGPVGGNESGRPGRETPARFCLPHPPLASAGEGEKSTPGNQSGGPEGSCKSRPGTKTAPPGEGWGRVGRFATYGLLHTNSLRCQWIAARDRGGALCGVPVPAAPSVELIHNGAAPKRQDQGLRQPPLHGSRGGQVA